MFYWSTSRKRIDWLRYFPCVLNYYHHLLVSHSEHNMESDKSGSVGSYTNTEIITSWKWIFIWHLLNMNCFCPFVVDFRILLYSLLLIHLELFLSTEAKAKIWSINSSNQLHQGLGGCKTIWSITQNLDQLGPALNHLWPAKKHIKPAAIWRVNLVNVCYITATIRLSWTCRL